MSGVPDEPDGAAPLDPDELDGLRYKHVQTRNELDELEQANIQGGLLWLSRARNKNVLSEGFIRRLHKRLFGDIWSWAGTFRTTEKIIGVDPFQIGVQLRMLLDDASYWVENQTYLPLEAAARFHHRLVKIHCFANGNGRHARIAADVYLEECFRHQLVDWAGGFNLIKSNERRNDYITSLRAADAGDYEPLLRFVCAKTKV